MSIDSPLRLVVLISGSGSNLQAIIDASKNNGFGAEVAAVISNRADAYGLERAAREGIATEVLEHDGHEDRESYDRALMELIDSYRPGLVILAGFMRILTPAFVERYAGRMLNIHPSLLPKFKGLHTHQRALDNGETEHGASVHFVTEELDGGPVVLRAKVKVKEDDDADQLAARVLEKEHLIYPAVVSWIAKGRLKMENGVPVMDGKQLEEPLLLEEL